MNNINYLFAVEAENLLESGKFSEAVQYCKEGISRFPDYPLGYSILARSYIESGEYASAIKIITTGLKKFPNNKSLLNIQNYFYQKINESELIQTDKGDFSTSDDDRVPEKFDEDSFKNLESRINKSNFLRKIQSEDDEQIFYDLKASNLSLIPGILDYTPLYIKTQPIISINHITPLTDLPDYPKFLYENNDVTKQFDLKNISHSGPVTDIFNQIAGRIENAIIPEQRTSTDSDLSADFSKSSMVSETIAQIYIHQNAFEDAINVYKKMAQMEPEKEEFFAKKIDEIVKIMNDYNK